MGRLGEGGPAHLTVWLRPRRVGRVAGRGGGRGCQHEGKHDPERTGRAARARGRGADAGPCGWSGRAGGWPRRKDRLRRVQLLRRPRPAHRSRCWSQDVGRRLESATTDAGAGRFGGRRAGTVERGDPVGVAHLPSSERGWYCGADEPTARRRAPGGDDDRRARAAGGARTWSRLGYDRGRQDPARALGRLDENATVATALL